MIKSFLILLSLLCVLVVITIGHYLSYDREAVEHRIEDISSLSKLSSLSWSVGYHEPRIQGHKRDKNLAYPQMQAINKMDFIYAQ